MPADLSNDLSSLLSPRARASTSSVIRDLLRLVDNQDVLSLAGGLPAAEAFPIDRLADAADRALQLTSPYGSTALQYGPTEGDDGLRALIADAAGGSVEQVLITAGSQQALDLVGRALLEPGDDVVIEAPSYVGGLQALRWYEPTFHPIPLDRDGLRVDLLADRLAAGLRPKLCYVIPNFQNPSGATLALERRVALAGLADRYGFVIVEDDPYGDLRFRGSPVPQVRTWSERVITIGTASKTLAPGLRIGWMTVPDAFVGPLVRIKQAADLHTSSLGQLICREVLADTVFMTAHLSRLRDVYRDRCDTLAAAVSAALPVELELWQPDGGMFLWVRLPGFDAAKRLNAAVRNGVAYVPGSAFFLGGGDDYLRMSFASVPREQLAVAAERLGYTLQTMSHRHRPLAGVSI